MKEGCYMKRVTLVICLAIITVLLTSCGDKDTTHELPYDTVTLEANE